MSNSFFKSFVILSGSNLIAQLINLLTYFILPKYFYSPSDFGTFGLFLAVYLILFEVVNLKMDQSIMLPEKEEDAKSLLFSSIFIAVIFSTISSVIFLLLGQFFNIDHHLVYLLGLSLLLGGFLQPIIVWLNRQGSYMRMGNVRIIQVIGTLGISIWAYYQLNNHWNGIIIGFIGGQVLALIFGLFLLPKSEFKLAEKSLIGQYKQFIQYGSLSSMISTLSKNLPVIALKFFFGNVVLGWYVLASKYLNAPIGIFSTSIGQVYFKEAAVAKQPRLKELTKTIARNIFAMIIIPTIALLAFGGDLFQWVFGDEWRQAGHIVQILILWYFVAYVSGPLSILIDVKLKLKWELSYNLILLLARASALSLAFVLKDVFYVLGIYAFVGLLFNCILLNYVLKLSRKDA